MKPAARLDLETPHRREMEHSVQRKARGGIRPRGVGGLLAWFLAGWSSEIPSRLHGPGVFFGRPDGEGKNELWARKSERNELVGGSLIGAPAVSDPFRRYIEGRAGETDADGFYVRPMHAALAHMAGRGHSDREYMALFLFAVATSGGDWQGVTYRSGIPPQVGMTYLEAALNSLWNIHSPSPLSVQETAA